MREYNDYISLTRRYLKNYNQFKVSAENMQEDIKALESTAAGGDDISAAIAHYGHEESGGFSELTTVERYAEKRLLNVGKIAMLKNDLREIKRTIDKIDKAVNNLSEEDRAVIKEHFFDGYAWEVIGRKHYYSAKWAKDHATKAVRQIAFMVFGLKAVPQKMSFVFAD